MLSIHPEVQHFVDEDETNYEKDEINKEILGKNEVGKLLLKAAQNNSVRRTCISKLLD